MLALTKSSTFTCLTSNFAVCFRIQEANQECFQDSQGGATLAQFSAWLAEFTQYTIEPERESDV